MSQNESCNVWYQHLLTIDVQEISLEYISQNSRLEHDTKSETKPSLIWTGHSAWDNGLNQNNIWPRVKQLRQTESILRAIVVSGLSPIKKALLVVFELYVSSYWNYFKKEWVNWRNYGASFLTIFLPEEAKRGKTPLISWWLWWMELLLGSIVTRISMLENETNNVLNTPGSIIENKYYSSLF